MRPVLGHQTADEQQIATYLKSPALQGFGAAIGRRVRTITDELRLPTVGFPVVGPHRLGIRDHDASAGRRELLAGPQVPAGEAAPLVPPPVGPVHVEYGPAAAELKRAHDRRVADAHANYSGRARQSHRAERSVRERLEMLLAHRRQKLESHAEVFSSPLSVMRAAAENCHLVSALHHLLADVLDACLKTAVARRHTSRPDESDLHGRTGTGYRAAVSRRYSLV